MKDIRSALNEWAIIKQGKNSFIQEINQTVIESHEKFYTIKDFLRFA